MATTVINVPRARKCVQTVDLGGVAVHATTFISHAGGVTQVVLSVENSLAWTEQVARGNLRVTLPNGRFRCIADLAIRPLKCFTTAFYLGGEASEFWGAYGHDDPLCKSWMAAGLEAIAANREMKTLGPYTIGWPYDKNGNGPGGQGIEPHRHLWRGCGAGRELAFEDAVGTANRMDVFVSDYEGMPKTILSVKMTTASQNEKELAKAGYTVPEAGTPYDYEHELNQYARFDGQHFSRAYGDAMWLAEQEHPWAKWYIGRLVKWQAGCYLSTTGYNSPNQAYWSLVRMVGAAQDGSLNPEACGRSGVHQARFALQASRVLNSVDASLLNRGWRQLFLEMAGPAPADLGAYGTEGIAYHVPPHAMAHPHWAGVPDGERGAQTRELYLAISLLDAWGLGLHAERIRQHPSMQGLPSAKVSLDSPWRSPAGHNPFYAMLASPENLTEFYYPAIKSLRAMANSRLSPYNGAEAGGAQPLNSCPPEVLEQL